MILLCYYYFGKYNLKPHNKAEVVRNDAIIYRGPPFQVSFFSFPQRWNSSDRRPRPIRQRTRVGRMQSHTSAKMDP